LFEFFIDGCRLKIDIFFRIVVFTFFVFADQMTYGIKGIAKNIVRRIYKAAIYKCL